MKIKVSMSTYLAAILLPDGRIYRHSTSASSGGSTISRWGFVPAGHQEEVGWGGKRYTATISPDVQVDLVQEDMDEIVAHATANPESEPPMYSAAWWYLDHLPYWGFVNDGNRDVSVHGPRPAVADRAAEVYRHVRSDAR